MGREKLLYFHQWFHNYVSKFYSSDIYIHKNIVLKEEHTVRVINNIVKLAKYLDLRASEINLAEVIALFHDIGRFEQFSKYQTYRDAKSENHALLGLQVIEETKVLDCLAPEEKIIITKAIAYHNVCSLPLQVESKVLLFSRLIRDADKLDSLDIIVNYMENRENEKNEALEDYPDTPDYSACLVADLLNNRNINYSQVKTVNDMKLTFLAWLLDVNFVPTLKKMKEKQYLERIINVLPKTEDIRKVYDHLQEYILTSIDKKKDLLNY